MARLTNTARRRVLRNYQYSLLLDATSKRIEMAGITNDPQSDHSFVMDISFKTEKNADSVYSQEDGTGTGRSWLRKSSTGEFETTLTGSTVGLGVFAPINEWIQVGVSYNHSTTTYTFYINGSVEYTNSSFTANSANGQHKIGVSKSDTNSVNAYVSKVYISEGTAWVAADFEDYYFDNIVPSSATTGYLFDEGTGTTLTDNIGSDNATLEGSDLWTGIVPNRRRLAVRNMPFSLLHKEVRSQVEFGNDAVYDATTAVTLETWVFPIRRQVTREGLIGKWDKSDATISSYLLLYLDSSDSINFSLRIGSVTNVHETGLTFPLNTWSHIVATYDSSNIYVYLNGALVYTAVQTGSIDTGTALVYMGSWQNESTQDHMFGHQAVSHIWNQSVTQDQVYDMYYNGIYPTGAVLDVNPTIGSGTTVTNNGTGPNGEIIGGQSTWNVLTPFKTRSANSQARTVVS
jgi:hypothetical protein